MAAAVTRHSSVDDNTADRRNRATHIADHNSAVTTLNRTRKPWLTNLSAWIFPIATNSATGSVIPDNTSIQQTSTLPTIVQITIAYPALHL